MPGKAILSTPIRDWPEMLQAGTLNVRVEGGFPADFIRNLGRADVRLLDSRRFTPEAELKWTEIRGNTLPPQPGQPDRGNAQVWRATLRNVNTGTACPCWAVRRIGSGLSLDLELVAGENLRDRLGLPDGTPVELELEGEWVGT